MWIILLTARGQEVDRITGFEAGADDYVVKPFSLRELVARVHVGLRRKTAGRPRFVERFGKTFEHLRCRNRHRRIEEYLDGLRQPAGLDSLMQHAQQLLRPLERKGRDHQVAAAAQRRGHLLIRDVGLNDTRTKLLAVLLRMGAQVREAVEDVEQLEPRGIVEVTGFPLRGTVIQGKEVPLDGVETELRRLAGAAKKRTLALKHDAKVPHGVIVAIQDAAKSAGMEKVVLVVP